MSILADNVNSNTNWALFQGGYWKNTGAITNVTLTLGNGNYATGSEITVLCY